MGSSGCLGKSKSTLRDNVRARFPRLSLSNLRVPRKSLIHDHCCCSLHAVSHKLPPKSQQKRHRVIRLRHATYISPFNRCVQNKLSCLITPNPRLAYSAVLVVSGHCGYIFHTAASLTSAQLAVSLPVYLQPRRSDDLESESSASFLHPVQRAVVVPKPRSNARLHHSPLTLVSRPCRKLPSCLDLEPKRYQPLTEAETKKSRREARVPSLSHLVLHRVRK